MTSPTDHPTARLKAAVAALQQRDGMRALAALAPLLAAGRADAAVFLAVAYAQALLQRPEAAQAAADRCLALEPRNVRALIVKADLFHNAQDLPAAMSCYAAACKAAEGQVLSGETRVELERAQQALAGYQQAMIERLAHELDQLDDQLGQQADHRSPRFGQALDILLGRREVFLQQPRQFFFPELPHVQFHERASFPWLADLEAATPAIRAELEAVLREDAAFVPYVQSDPKRPVLNRGGLLDSTDWSAFYLWQNGRRIDENAERCPRTMAALEAVPLVQVPGRSPSVLFSRLKPGAHIPAHHGFVNTRLIGHLPLIVPPGCRFRVGNEIRPWVEGQAWIFDDTIEHEAWNPSAETRVVMIFEVWPPALLLHERDLVSAMYRIVDGQPGAPPPGPI